ncbi:hypothetical protein CRUP_024535 [Coryphaenoides rupestris]|nr:hypothetical protein CRUP_024535 [Coryphaenoides rupestris]
MSSIENEVKGHRVAAAGLQGVPSAAGAVPLAARCSASCGKGFKNRTVSCVTGSGRPVPEENCPPLSKPAKQRRCRGARCPKWKTGSWGECSATCGAGTQRREVSCVAGNRRGPAHETETECSKRSRPASGQPCRVAAECSARYQWREEEWQPGRGGREEEKEEEEDEGRKEGGGREEERRRRESLCRPCSKSCGWGHRRRTLRCVDQLGAEVHDTYCGQPDPGPGLGALQQPPL